MTRAGLRRLLLILTYTGGGSSGRGGGGGYQALPYQYGSATASARKPLSSTKKTLGPRRPGGLRFGTTTLSGSTGFAPATWTDTPMPGTATTATAIRARMVAGLYMIRSFLSLADIAAK